jgi:hypothetical protein
MNCQAKCTQIFVNKVFLQFDCKVSIGDRSWCMHSSHQWFYKVLSPVMVPERTAVGVTQMASLKKCNFAEVDSESQGWKAESSEYTR